MKIVVINQQTFLARHWFKWYRVQRGGEDWRVLGIGKQYHKPKKFDYAKTAKNLKSLKFNPPLPTNNDNA